MGANNQLIIPEAARSDADSREVMRAWISDGRLQVSLFIPDDWHDPGNGDIALCDVARHVADAYRQNHGGETQDTLRRIHDAFVRSFRRRPTHRLEDLLVNDIRYLRPNCVPQQRHAPFGNWEVRENSRATVSGSGSRW